jgi:hypothetical protein
MIVVSACALIRVVKPSARTPIKKARKDRMAVIN